VFKGLNILVVVCDIQGDASFASL